MFTSATASDNDGGSSSHIAQNDPYDGQEDSGDIYDNEPLILNPPSGKYFNFLKSNQIKCM